MSAEVRWHCWHLRVFIEKCFLIAGILLAVFPGWLDCLFLYYLLCWSGVCRLTVLDTMNLPSSPMLTHSSHEFSSSPWPHDEGPFFLLSFCRAGLVVMNCLSLCLSWNILVSQFQKLAFLETLIFMDSYVFSGLDYQPRFLGFEGSWWGSGVLTFLSL